MRDHGAPGLVLALTLALSCVARPASAQTTAGGSADTLRLDLAAAVGLAAERSAAVRLEELGTEAAAARVTEERGALLPHLSIEATHGDRTFNTASFGLEFPTAPGEDPLFDPDGEVIGPVTTIDVRGRLSQTLFDWSAVEKLRSARRSLDAGRARTGAVRDRVAANAAAAYVQAIRAQGRMEARLADAALAEELVGVARELLQAGVGVRLDVTRAESRLAAVTAELVGATSGAARTRLALLRALALPLDTPLLLVDELPAAPTAGPEDAGAAVSTALSRRGEMKELAARIDAARLDVAAVRAERLPSVALVAGDGFTGAGYGHLLNTYEWALRVSVPVFDGMRRSARVEEERTRLAGLDTRRADLAEQVAFEVRDALLRLEAAARLVEAGRARLDLAQEELDQARERFAAGVAGSADVFTATLTLNQARTADVDARAAWLDARVALAVAQGTVGDLR